MQPLRPAGAGLGWTITSSSPRATKKWCAAGAFATDVCVRKDGIDPSTHQRHLEELAFEVVSEQRMRDITERAEDLAARGVRRIIGVFLKKDRVGEWSPSERTWRWLPPEGLLDDPCLASPIPVQALLQATSAAQVQEVVARGVIETKHPVIEQVIEQGRQCGIHQGIQQGIHQGLAPLVRLLERRLARGLTAAEHQTLLKRLSEQGAELVGDAVLDLPEPEIAAWLVHSSTH
jgi:hypothetical protein